MEYARQLLDEVGLGADRLAMYEIAASDAPKFVAAVKEMTDRVKELGPSPLHPLTEPRAGVRQEPEVAVAT